MGQEGDLFLCADSFLVAALDVPERCERLNFREYQPINKLCRHIL